VTDEQRQVGKVQELALGFLGGPGAFTTFGRIYGVNLSEAQVQRAVRGWRNANRWAMQHGEALERAYTSAMRHKGHEVTAGRITYLFDGQHLWYALPSGRILCYPHARLDADGVSYAKASWKPSANAKEWPRGRLWRGLACENVTQAAAHDLLRGALRRLDDVVLHVHDEIVVECAASQADATAAELARVMTTAPQWASGLPLAIGTPKILERYGK
jgi:DNA polymerase